MTDQDFGDFFVSESDVDLAPDEDEPIKPPVVVPPAIAAIPEVAAESSAGSGGSAEPPNALAQSQADVPPEPLADEPTMEPDLAVQGDSPSATSATDTSPHARSREDRLAAALERLLEDSQDIEAAALVSLDGFTMASALPAGMQEDRVGAMSAAILGLGERAAVELGKGKLSQVFIEGDGGYVMLIAAGDRAVLTCLADEDAKLGLVLYDMRLAAQSIGEILG